MKNKFLLLGATALLSTGFGLKTMADDPQSDLTATVKAHIGLYEANKITILSDLEFGTYVSTGEHTHASVRLDPEDNVINITGEGVELAQDSTNSARIAVNVPTGYKSTLNIPSGSVKLRNNDTKDVVFLSLEEYHDASETRGVYKFDYYNIGGSINLPAGNFRGDYSGSFVVTAILEVDPDYVPEEP